MASPSATFLGREREMRQCFLPGNGDVIHQGLNQPCLQICEKSTLLAHSFAMSMPLHFGITAGVLGLRSMTIPTMFYRDRLLVLMTVIMTIMNNLTTTCLDSL